MIGNVVNNLIHTNQSSGYKSLLWNATNNQGQPVSAGVYLNKMQAGDFVDTKKMIILVKLNTSHYNVKTKSIRYGNTTGVCFYFLQEHY